MGVNTLECFNFKTLFWFLTARTYDNLDACVVVRSPDLATAASLMEVGLICCFINLTSFITELNTKSPNLTFIGKLLTYFLFHSYIILSAFFTV